MNLLGQILAVVAGVTAVIAGISFVLFVLIVTLIPTMELGFKYARIILDHLGAGGF